MLRSILSILAGYGTLTLATMLGLLGLAKAFGLPLDPRRTSETPSKASMHWNLAVSFAAALLGGFVAAHLALAAPRPHALVLGALVLALGAAYAVQGRGGVRAAWYLMVLPGGGAAGCAAGGLLEAALKS